MQMSVKERNYTHAADGFTLVEMIVVITIMLTLMAGAYYGISTYQQNARKQAASTMLAKIANAIETYQVTTGDYPDSLKDLATPPAKEVKNWSQQLPDVPKDPFGNPYVYRRTPEGDKPYELYSYGPNKRDPRQRIYPPQF